MNRLMFVPPAVFAAMLLCSCNGPDQSWKIEDVQPPASLKEALLKIDAENERNSLQPTEPIPPLTITRDGAILTALARNRSLNVDRYNPDIRRTFIDDERAAFDPLLLATVTAGRTNTPSTDRFGEERNEATDTINVKPQITNRFATGTEVTLSGSSTFSDPEYRDQSATANSSLRVSQSLLKGAGATVNLVSLRQAKNNAEISSQAFRDTVLTLIQNVENRYWALVLARETMRIREAALGAAQEQLRGFTMRYQLGSATQADLLSAEANVATRESELLNAKGSFQLATLDLLRLISPETPEQWNASILATDPPEIAEILQSRDISSQLAMKYRPDLAQSRLEFSNAELEIIQTKNGLLPKLDGFVTYGANGYAGALDDAVTELRSQRYNEYSTGLEFEYSPLNRRARAQQKRAEFSQQQAQASLGNLEEQILYQIHSDIVNLETNYQRIAAAEKLLSSRKEQLRSITARQEAGSATILDVLDVQNDVIDAEVNDLRARIDYITSLTTLYRDEGTLLDRRGIGLPEVVNPTATPDLVTK